LGGRTLAPAVGPDAPKRFLSHQQEKGAWRKLLDQIDQSLVGEDDRKVAASTAQTVFDLFETSAKAVSGT
jgi:heme oxygenase